jgi:hypothetical protein
MPLHVVEDFFVKSYQLEHRAEAANEVLSPLGMDIETFLKTGPSLLGDEYRNVMERFLDVRFECHFLAAGFGELNTASLFSVYPPGRSSRCITDFWAIGSGAESALSVLMFRAHRQTVPHQLGLYHVCEAKFMSESALGVGPTTTVGVFKNDGSFGRLSQEGLQAIRERWAKEGVPKIPADIQTEVERSLQWHKGRSYGPKTGDTPWP